MSSKSRISIGVKFNILIALLIFTFVATTAISFWSSKRFVGQIDDLGKVQLPGLSNMILADMMHDGIRANVFSAIIASGSKDAAEIKAIKEERDEFASNIRNHVAGLKKLDLSEATKKAIEPALPRIEEYVNSANEVTEVALSGNAEKVKLMLPKFVEKFEALEKELSTLGDLIRGDVASSTARGIEIENSAKYFNFSIFATGLIVLIFFILVIKEQQKQLKSIISNLNEQTLKISETSNELTKSSENLSASTDQQSSAFQESASALEEITATAGTTETNSKRLESNAKSSFESANYGKQTIGQMLDSMNLINNSNQSIMKQIEEGNKEIGEIVKVIGEIETKTKVINDIVFQTKLLSFNASVEAARAGEQGKGFAVVAEEVGNLAQMSGNAAKDISDMLASSIRTVETIVNRSKSSVESLSKDGRVKVEQGIEIATKCGTALDEIVQQASNINLLISDITKAVQEQSVGINEVSKAMGLLDKTSAQNSIISKENLSTSVDLKGQVESLEVVIESLSSMMTRK